jgi:hypothetical protein
MSLRPSLPHSNQKAACGSLFGAPVGLWSSMAISPPRSPSASPPSLATGAVFERLDELSLAPAALVAGIQAPGPVRNLVHVHGVSSDDLAACALVYFEDAGEEILASPTRRSLGAVLPRLVFADTIGWHPIVAPDGARGLAFTLRLQGEVQATVEVIGERICVLQAAYSALAIEAGMASPASRLVFDITHAEELAAVIESVRADDELGFLPNTELLVGRALDRIPLRGWGVAGDLEARELWKHTRERLRRTNPLVAAGISLQNQRELETASVPHKEVSIVSLGAYFS